MRSWWVLALVGTAGCDRLLGLDHLPTETSDGNQKGVNCDNFAAVEPVGFAVEPGITPASDFSVSANELRALVSGTTKAKSLLHTIVLSRASRMDPWDVDPARDSFPPGDFPRLAPNGDSAFAVTVRIDPQAGNSFEVTRFAFNSDWLPTRTIEAMLPQRPRLLSAGPVASETVLLVAHDAEAADYAWSSVDMFAMRQPALEKLAPVSSAALSADGLTVVYTQPGPMQTPPLMVSHRSSLSDPFDAGALVDIELPNHVQEAVDLQIVGACNRLYFRLGTTVYMAR